MRICLQGSQHERCTEHTEQGDGGDHHDTMRVRMNELDGSDDDRLPLKGYNRYGEADGGEKMG